MGPDARSVLSTASKKQTAVSHSTPEAEIVALDHTLRTLAIPASMLWDRILGREVTVTLGEDNQACIQ
eukprot:11380407-Alexandrium_andersonii.AAC.1